MEIKDIMFYILSVVSAPYALYEGYRTVGHAELLKAESPECFRSNPNIFSILIATWLFLICLMTPIQRMSK